MFKKIMMVAAAVAMPVAAVTAVTAVAGPGIAGAKALPPIAETCSQSGAVAFAKPGLSYGGTVTNKTVETTDADITAAATQSSCSIKEIKLKITAATDACTNSVASCNARTAKEVTKDPYYYDTALSYVLDGTDNLATALANGIATKDNGTAVTLEYGNSTAIAAGHQCGSAVGFLITGNVNTASGPTGLTYADTICITGDTPGANTTDNFANDLQSAAGGGDPVIATAIIGGASQLVISS
jgi:hypothetical protein